MSEMNNEFIHEKLGSVRFIDSNRLDWAASKVLIFGKNPAHLMSLRELALARTLVVGTGAHYANSILERGSWVAEESLILPNGNRYWLRPKSISDTLVFSNRKQFGDAQDVHEEYYPAKFDLEKHLEKLGKDNYYLLDSNDLRGEAPVGRFSDFGCLRFGFGDQLEAYEDLCKYFRLEHIGIIPTKDSQYYNESYIKSQPKMFVNQIHFDAMNAWHNIDYNYHNSNGTRFRAVRDDAKTMMGGEKSLDMRYTAEFAYSRIKDALKKEGVSVSDDLDNKVLLTLKTNP